MSRKYVQLGKTNAENVDVINDNFAELYDARTSIYDDVEQLQADVAQLQTDMATAQSDIIALQNMSGRTPLSANTDLNCLGAGHYYIPNYDTSVTITNKPDSTGQTAAINGLKAGIKAKDILTMIGENEESEEK